MPSSDEALGLTAAALAQAQALSLQPPALPGSQIIGGSWTPTDASGAGLALTVAGRWNRIGNLIFARALIIYPVTASGAAAKIGGLPFVTQPGNFANLQAFITYSSAVALYLQPDVGALTLSAFSVPGTGPLTNIALSNSNFYFTAIYETTP
jgi:hypothetical protein